MPRNHAQSSKIAIKSSKKTPDLVLKRQKYKLDLIPPTLVVSRYFAAEQDDIDVLQVKRDAACTRT